MSEAAPPRSGGWGRAGPGVEFRGRVPRNRGDGGCWLARMSTRRSDEMTEPCVPDSSDAPAIQAAPPRRRPFGLGDGMILDCEDRDGAELVRALNFEDEFLEIGAMEDVG